MKLGAALGAWFFLFAATAAQAQTLPQLPTATTPLTGSELMYVVQGGVSKQVPSGSLPFNISALLNQSVNLGTGSLTATGGTFTGTLGVTGAATFSGGLTGTLTGGASLDLPLADGTLSGALHLGTNTLDGSAIAVTGGTLNGVAIGSTTPSAGAFTALSATSTVSGAGFTALLSPYAPLLSPAFTGTPTAPTAPVLTSSTQLATTAFVANSFAPSASPALTGTPTAPTAAAATNTTQLATTAYVVATIKAPPAAGYGATTPAPVAATTLSASGAITPNGAAGIVGTTAANNANAGSVGEYISATVPSGSAVSLTAGTPANVTSISLTAGDWDVMGTVAFVPAATTSVTISEGAVGTASGALPGAATGAEFNFITAAQVPNGNYAFPVGRLRVSVATTTTVYLVASSNFTASTLAAFGFIGARRVR